jgi:protocatechuate 3,4-dioxygenase beta subunit
MAHESDSHYFTEWNSEAVVIGRAGPRANPRVKQIVDSVVRHLHAVVKETEPTIDEWLQAIQFLTKTGQFCTDWRQEFILLSDTLGASMLVETVNNRKPSGETESTVLGPFHVQNAPRYENGASICIDGKGEPLWVSGCVRDVNGRPIAGATLDVWQANEDGFYDVQQKGIQPDNNLRGIFTSDACGCYAFRSVYPRYYPIPGDGTVGALLKALDRRPNRPAHIHFIVGAPGFKSVTTHIFTPDCPWLRDDAVFGVKESLIADFAKSHDKARAAKLGLPCPFWEVEWDFVLSSA